MRRRSFLCVKALLRPFSTSTDYSALPPIVHIDNGTFYRQYPSSTKSDNVSNPPLFPQLQWRILADPLPQQHWAVIGASNAGKTTLLEILLGRHISIPSNARTFPFLSTRKGKSVDHQVRSIQFAIQYVGFSDQGGGMGTSGAKAAYMCARYESW